MMAWSERHQRRRSGIPGTRNDGPGPHPPFAKEVPYGSHQIVGGQQADTWDNVGIPKVGGDRALLPSPKVTSFW